MSLAPELADWLRALAQAPLMCVAVAANEVHAWVRSFVDCLQRRSAP